MMFLQPRVVLSWPRSVGCFVCADREILRALDDIVRRTSDICGCLSREWPLGTRNRRRIQPTWNNKISLVSVLVPASAFCLRGCPSSCYLCNDLFHPSDCFRLVGGVDVLLIGEEFRVVIGFCGGILGTK